MPNLDARLESLQIVLPDAPAPLASYVPAVSVHSGSLLFVSGQLPFEDGKLLAKGRVPDQVSLEMAQKCARRCVINGLAALRREMGSFERLRRVVRLGVFVNAGEGFADQPKVGNGASDLLVELLGDDGRHARAAVGVSSLPLDAPVEIEFTFLVD